MPAFGLRLSHHGSKSWFLMTRLDGRLLRVTLGRYPAISLADAREQARGAARVASEGRDPRLINAEAKRKRHEERQNTYRACAADFLEKHAKRRLRPSTQREYRRILTGADTRHWCEKPIVQLTKRDVLDVLEAIDRRGSPGAAKRTLVYLRKFFNWCAERDILTVVPTDRIRAPHPEVKRDRVLSEEELRCVLQAIDAEQSIFRPLIRILLLTGQRRAEVAGMRWSELRNLDGTDALWEIPSERTKNKQSHLVPLSPAVRKIIRSMPKVGDLVFTTTGETPVSGFGRAKERLDARVNAARSAEGLPHISAWTLHDLRRTMVTVMNERLGVAPHIVEAVVNHMSGLAKAGVAGVYNRALYLEDRRLALHAWAKYLARLASRAAG
jgi:integrase